ncbi:MAG: hypothetical protein WB713_10095 [Methyloceanibacter sp.]
MTIRDPENFVLQLDMPAIQRGEHLAYDIEEFVIAGRTCDFGPYKYDTAFLAGMHEATDQAALQGDREDAYRQWVSSGLEGTVTLSRNLQAK